MMKVHSLTILTNPVILRGEMDKPETYVYIYE